MKHIANYKPNEFAKLLNVSVKTLQRWDRDKILIAKRTLTDRRYYTYDQYLEFKGILIVTFACSNEESREKLIKMSEDIGGVETVKSIQNGNKSNGTTKTKD